MSEGLSTKSGSGSSSLEEGISKGLSPVLKFQKSIVHEVVFDNKSDTLSKDQETIVVKHYPEHESVSTKDLNCVEENAAQNIDEIFKYKIENNLTIGNVKVEQQAQVEKFEPRIYGN